MTSTQTYTFSVSHLCLAVPFLTLLASISMLECNCKNTTKGNFVVVFNSHVKLLALSNYKNSPFQLSHCHTIES